MTTESLTDNIIAILDDDVRASVAPALRSYGLKQCVRDWFLRAANDQETPYDRMTYAKWACQVIQAAVRLGRTF